MSEQIPRRAVQHLRKARVLDALGKLPAAHSEHRERDSVIPLLAHVLAGEALPEAPEALDEFVEAAISVALSRVNEQALDRLTVLVLTGQLLATAGEFARLAALIPSLTALASALRAERPFLATTLEAFAKHLNGREADAIHGLRSTLGLTNDGTSALGKHTTEQVVDILVANAFRSWISREGTTRLVSARQEALKHNHATSYELAEFLDAYVSAHDRYSVMAAVTAYCPIFKDGELQLYLENLPVRRFFPAQLRAIQDGVLEPGSFVLAIPTSAGKTLLAELRIVAELARNPKAKVVYLSPYKTLSRQVEDKLQTSLRVLKKSVRDLGAEFDVERAAIDFMEPLPDVAVMTPERFDALLRLATTDREGASDARAFLEDLSLLIVDEVQLLGRLSRGPRLELILLRIRQRLPALAVLSMTGVSDNAQCLATWLGATPQLIPSTKKPTGVIELLWEADGTLIQRELDKPISVDTISRSGTAYRDAAALVLSFRPEYWPILILETTKENAVRSIIAVMEQAPRAGDRFRSSLREEELNHLDYVAEDARIALGDHSKLPALLQVGLAYHHAGLPAHLLRQIERLASLRLLRVIATTTTIAEGAHLPFQVVVMPHLTFGPSDLITPELYRNIAGRAGRAGVSHEGIVVVLGSPSKSLKGYVRGTLWRKTPIEVVGQLGHAVRAASSMRAYSSYRDIEGQVLAWLGEEGSYVDDQPQILSQRSLSWLTAKKDIDRELITDNLKQVIERLEGRELIIAGSPYRLTQLGNRARLAGLSAFSCQRIDRLTSLPTPAFNLGVLEGVVGIEPENAHEIVSAVFQALEMLECSLWLRRTGDSDQVRTDILRSIESGERDWPYDDELFKSDIALLALWITGADFAGIASRAPLFDRGLFQDKPGTRAADAADYIVNVAGQAAWVWSAITVMLEEQYPSIPLWIRRAIELGIPTEFGTEVMVRADLSRAGGLLLSERFPSAWDEGKPHLLETTSTDLRHMGLSQADASRFRAWRNKQP